MKIMIEGLDRLGKDTLIQGIQHQLGYHLVLHYSKPEVLEYYHAKDRVPDRAKRIALESYQYASFRTLMQVFNSNLDVIANRAHLGECVYAPLYRGYTGDYVFDIERAFLRADDARLVLLTEDFAVSKHFVDDGLSFDITKREEEQNMFIASFEKSTIKNKRIVCVTDQGLGGFRPKADILAEVLA